MGRGKGRAKGIDITKHFFQPTGLSDRICVQISPSHLVHVSEEDLSPTQGSESALALQREGRLEGPMKLCVNWRQGNCHSHAACGNAHVAAYFNNPSLSSVGNVGITSPRLGSPPERPRDDGDYGAPHHRYQQRQQQQQQHPHQQQHQQSSTAAADSSRVVEHKSPATTTRSTPIPAPRSQQANRHVFPVGCTSVSLNSPSSAMSWNRGVAVNGSQHGGGPPNSQQYQQQQQQQEFARQQQGALQGRMGGWGSQKLSDDVGRQVSNGAVMDTLMDATPYSHHGRIDGVKKETVYSARSNRCSDGAIKDSAAPFTQSNTLGGNVVDDAWVNTSLGQTSGIAAIWCDGGVGMWDLPPGDAPGATPAAATTPKAKVTATNALRTATLPMEVDSVFVGREQNIGGLVAPRGDLWGSFKVSGTGSEQGMSGKKPLGMPTSSEALKNQLLRELVGAGSDDVVPSFVSETLPKEMKSTAQDGTSSCLVGSGSALDLLSLLGGSGEREGKTGMTSSMPTRSAHTIQHLMSLLTTE